MKTGELSLTSVTLQGERSGQLQLGTLTKSLTGPDIDGDGEPRVVGSESLTDHTEDEV